MAWSTERGVADAVAEMIENNRLASEAATQPNNIGDGRIVDLEARAGVSEPFRDPSERV